MIFFVSFVCFKLILFGLTIAIRQRNAASLIVIMVLRLFVAKPLFKPTADFTSGSHEINVGGRKFFQPPLTFYSRSPGREKRLIWLVRPQMKGTKLMGSKKKCIENTWYYRPKKLALTHWGLDQNAILKTTFSIEFSWKKILYFDSNFSEFCSQDITWFHAELGRGRHIPSQGHNELKGP